MKKNRTIPCIFTFFLIVFQLIYIPNIFAQSSAIASGNPELSEVLFQSPNLSMAQMSPSGQFVAGLIREGKNVSIAINEVNKLRPTKQLLNNESGKVPSMFFYGANDSELFILARDNSGKTLLLNGNPITGEIETVESDIKPAFASLSPSNGYKFPLISIKEKDGSNKYKVWNQRKNFFADVVATSDITPVAILPHGMPGYIGLKSDHHSLNWVYVHDGKEETVIAQFSSAEKPNRAELISLYQGVDRRYKAAMLDSEDSDAIALVEVDLLSGRHRIMQEHRADIVAVSLAPETLVPDAVKTDYLSPNWIGLTNSSKPFFRRLSDLPGYLDSIWRSTDDRTWMASYSNSSNFKQYYLLNTNSDEISPIPFLNENEREFQNAVEMHSLVTFSDDKLELVSYLTYPKNKSCSDQKPCPLVVQIHGGPRSRDRIGYSKERRLLTNLGFAVLNVNYRGSGGFGKRFASLGAGQWGGKMFSDVLDVTKKVLATGNFDSKRVAVMGGSHGGYLSLMGATDKSNLFQCAISVAGTSDLEFFIRFNVKNDPEISRDLYKQIGNPDNQEDKKEMYSRSPISRVQQMNTELLLLHGAKDKSAPIEDIEIFSRKLSAQGKPHSFIAFPNGTHSLASMNDVFYTATAGFLNRCFNVEAGGNKQIALPPSVDLRRDDHSYFSMSN